MSLKSVSIRIGPDLYKKVDSLATKEQRSLNKQLLILIEKGLKK